MNKKRPGLEQITSGQLGVIYSCAQPARVTGLTARTQITFMRERKQDAKETFPSVFLPMREYRLVTLKLTWMNLEQTMRMWSQNT